MRAARLLGATALALAAAALNGVVHAAPPADAPSVLPIELIDVETGGTVKLEPGAKVLHIVAFATWCRPCEDELARLTEWEARFGAGGYRLAIVALPERQTRERLLAFMRERRPPGHLYFDGSRRLQKALGVDGVPAHYLLDSQGRVRVTAGSVGEIGVGTVEELLREARMAPESAR